MRQLSKKYKLPIDKHEKMSNIKEMQIKTTIRFHVTLVRMVVYHQESKKQVLMKMWEKETLYTVHENVN
jgi:hypothetical protein